MEEDAEHIKTVTTKLTDEGHEIILFILALLPLRLEGDYLISEPEGCASVNFSDLPKAEVLTYAEQMTAHSAASFAGPLKNAGYLNIPVTYIVCEKDTSVPPDVQRSVVDMISRKSGREVITFSCDSGHFPTVSVPGKEASLINQVATRILRE
ncbi:hypothetical protein LB503_007828, partial [Fusarium chuoi]